MRVSPIILSLVCVGAFTPFLSRADGSDAPAPPGYAWCALERLSGRVLVPAGWFCREVHVPNGTGYQITGEEVVSKGTDYRNGSANDPRLFDFNRLSKSADFRTGFTIKVISGPFWNKSRLSKLADGLFGDRKREGRVSELMESSIGTYTARSFSREGVESAGNVIETKHFVELIVQDTETPTLILVAFDCPLSAWPENKDCCDKFFVTLSLFQGDKQANHSTYSPHAPATKAAAEATAQAVAADHDPVGMQQSVPEGATFRMRGPQ
jgi:hypothetical protein